MKRLLILSAIIALLWTGFGTKEAYASQENERSIPKEAQIKDALAAEIPKLTKEFLADTWINEHGFVCEYSDTVCYYNTNIKLSECKITKSGIEGQDETSDSKKSINIQVVSQDSIKVNDVTAYRWDSEKGKAFLADLKKQLLGEWVWMEDLQYTESPVTITNDKFQVIFSQTEKIDSLYNIDRATILLWDISMVEPLHFQIDGDKVTLRGEWGDSYFYRKDSTAYLKYMEVLNNYFVGKWAFTKDEKTADAIWEVTKDQVTCTSFKKNAKPKTMSYTITREYGIGIEVNGVNYTAYKVDDEIRLYDDKRNTYVLVDSTSAEGKKLIQNAKILLRNGKTAKRSYTYKIGAEGFKNVKITLQCKNNILLEDAITMEAERYTTPDWMWFGMLHVKINTKYSKATITLQYDPKKLGNISDQDIAMSYEKGNEIIALKCKVNKKKHTLTVTYQGDGNYYIDNLAYDYEIKGLTL